MTTLVLLRFFMASSSCRLCEASNDESESGVLTQLRPSRASLMLGRNAETLRGGSRNCGDDRSRTLRRGLYGWSCNTPLGRPLHSEAGRFLIAGGREGHAGSCLWVAGCGTSKGGRGSSRHGVHCVSRRLVGKQEN